MNPVIKYRIKKTGLWIMAWAALAGSSSISFSAWRDNLVSFTDPYQRVLAKYTRQEQSFSLNQVDTEYRWIATYHSPAFLKAVDGLLEKYYPNGFPPYAQQLRSDMESRGQMEIFVAMYAKSRQLKKLLGQENLWQVQLIADGRTMQPVLVKQVEINPMHHKIYPYLTKWYQGFRLIFPFDPGPTTSEFELQISGPLGSHRVKFSGG